MMKFDILEYDGMRFEGKACSPWLCPIALWLKEGGFKDVSVGSHIMAWTKGYEEYFEVPLPPSASNFITRFDREALSIS